MKAVRAYPRPFWIGLIAGVLFFYGIQSTYPIMPLFIEGVLGGSRASVGTATLITAGVAVFSRIAAGIASDKWGRRPFIILGGACYALAPFLYLSGSVPVFILGRVTHGLGLGIYTATYKAMVAEITPRDRRGEAMALSNLTISLALVIAPLFGEILYNLGGYNLVFLLGGTLGAAGVALVWTLPRTEERQAPPKVLLGFVELISRRGMWAGIIGSLGIGTPFAALIAFYPLLSVDRGIFAGALPILRALGVSIGFSAYALAGILIPPVVGRLSDRLGIRWQLLIPAGIVLSAGALVLGGAEAWPVVYLGVILTNAGIESERALLDAIVQDDIPDTLRGTAAALAFSSFDLSAALGAQTLGLIGESSGYGALFGAAAIFSAVMAAGTALIAAGAGRFPLQSIEKRGG
jgi:MFS family permease